VPFTFDDKPTIVDNPIVRNLSYFVHPSEASKFTGFAQHGSLKKRYVGHLSFALNYRAHGLNVMGYHITNLLIHILNGMLLYSLIMMTFRTPRLSDSSLKDSSGTIALFAALLFVLHPVQTQAVTYIVQRFTSMAATFYLFSLVCYIRSRLGTVATKRHLLFALSVLFAALAMETKEVAFTLPASIALYEFMFFSGKIKRRALYLIPLFLTMLIIPLSHLELDKPLLETLGEMDEATTIRDISRFDYLMTEFRVVVTYLRLLVLPVNQNLDYSYPIYGSFFNAPVLLSFLFLSSILGLGVYLLYRSRSTDSSLRLSAFGIFWFFITLSVTSSIIPLHVIYEHRMYLPSIGMITAFVIFISLLIKRRELTKSFLIPAMALIVVALTGTTYARNSVWKSEISLWRDVVQKSPDNARGHNNLGTAYDEEGMYDRAINHFRAAIRLLPTYAEAHNNLGAILEVKGMTEDAIQKYRTAVELKPDYEEAHNNLGTIYYATGRKNSALDHYRIVLKLNPYHAEAYYNLANIYQTEGLTDMAVEQYKAALKSKPDFAEAHNNLAVAYISKGLNRMAIEHLQLSLRLKPDNAEAHFNLGIAYLNKGFTEKARREFEAALKLRPGYQKAIEHLERLNTLP
jgi:tetratricopeptide (TPR) repeat protein